MAEPLRLPIRLTRSPLSLLMEYVEEILDQEGEINAGALYPRVHREFGGDPDFTEQVYADALMRLLQDACQRVVMKNRARLKPLGQGYATEELIQAEMGKVLTRWYESASRGVYSSVMHMPKLELGLAIARDRKQIDAQTKRVNFLQELYDGLERDDQTPSQRYTNAEVAEIFVHHYGREGTSNGQAVGD